MAARRITLGRTAWGVLHALAQNNGRGFVSWGRRYPELSPGRAVVMMGAYHQVVSQGLITSRGQNAPGTYALTFRGVEAYLRGSVMARAREGVYLDTDTGEPFTGTIGPPQRHKWAREKIRMR